MTNVIEEAKEEERQKIRYMRKNNLVDNLDSLGLSPNKQKEFIKYYYLNLDEMNLMEALDEFKKLCKKESVKKS